MRLEGVGQPVFSLAVTRGDGGWTTVTGAGELDIANTDAFVGAIRGGLEAGPVVVDLEQLTFRDSSGVRALDAALGDAAETGNELRVLPGLHPNVAQVLEMTGMMPLLPIGGRP